MSKESIKLEMQIERIGKSQKFEIRIYFADEPPRLAYQNQARLAEEKARQAVVKSVCEKFPEWLNGAELEQQMIDQLDRIKQQEDASRAEQAVPSHNATPPSMLHRPDLSGIVVPSFYSTDAGPVTKWELFVQHQGGQRQAIPIEGAQVHLDHDLRLTFTPPPASGLADRDYTWSPERRQAWLDGADTPHVRDVVERIIDQLNRYIQFPGSGDDQACWLLVIAIFIVISYVYEAFGAVPYLWISGPTGSGKTRLLELLSQLVFRPVFTSSASSSVLFRSLDGHGGTLLLDEAESLAGQSEKIHDLRSVLLMGNRRKGSYVARNEKSADGQFVPRRYRVFGPKVIAGIAGVTPALASRSISLRMFRNRGEKSTQVVDGNAVTWQELRDDLHEIAVGNVGLWSKLADVRKQREWEGLGGRDLEIWAPILAFAEWLTQHDYADREVVPMLLHHIQGLIEKNVEETISGRESGLLLAVKELVMLQLEADNPNWPRPKEVLTLARQNDPIEFRHVSERKAAALLKRYGIRTHQGRQHVYDDGVVATLKRVQIEYGIDLGFTDE